MGNPPFGHSGEKAISLFFKTGEGQKYQSLINDEAVWRDLIDFEGNANALRLLTHQFSGRRQGGFGMTYTTVASIVKYDSQEEAEQLMRIKLTCKEVTDTNEQIAFIRATVIGKLVKQCTAIFIENHDQILDGTFSGSLIAHLTGSAAQAMKQCEETGFNTIYKHPSVVEIEIAGFRILGSLLKEFTHAVMHPNDHFSGLLLPFIPQQYRVFLSDWILSQRSKRPLKRDKYSLIGIPDVPLLSCLRAMKSHGLSH
jgi:dGTP triphosphohydrolase